MDLSKIVSKNPPEDIYAFIEIPKDSNIKYELNKESGVIFVDRVLFTAMYYPFNYGFVPNTLAEDGDPIDIVVISEFSVVPGSVIRCSLIGMLEMEDEAGIDTKLLAVPHKKIDPSFSHIKDVDDLPQHIKDKIKHFFEHYKELEQGKWVKLKNFLSKEKAAEELRKAIERFSNK
ncbi:MAG: inorganic diphosphatase [Hydrogenobaculum sp.]